ncbi:phosphotransferase [Oceanospirillum maris]|uniref:phosphotransferase n=1 Tax=Oceanospirillum maris TaxID=64977 RepID=UPI000408C300|nr:phosphotransferase [Oceanospirillum maris]
MHEAIFEQVNRQLNVYVHWMPVSRAGTSNRLYQGSSHDQVLILRINARNGLAFGVSRQREAEVLERIQGQPWGLQVLCNRPDLGWCLMAHHGLSLGVDAITDNIRYQLLTAVKNLQEIPLPADTAQRKRASLDYPELFEHYQRCLNKESDPLHWLNLLNRLVQLFVSLPNVPRCYTHHDLHPGNCCWRNDQLVLIDWEYAGIGNPWFDAATLYRHCSISAKELRALPAFRHLTAPMFELGLQQAQEAARLLETLWHKARH